MHLPLPKNRPVEAGPGVTEDHAWTLETIEALFDEPFMALLARAHEIHMARHDPHAVQLSTLLSVKTGGCPEDCAYCPQAQRYHTGVEAQKLLELGEVVASARAAKAAGATRFCMGAAWRGPKDRDIPKVAAMIREIKALGMEACATLGLLGEGQAEALKAAGLDYYNHNIDTAPDYYGEIIHTREFKDRLNTLDQIRQAGLKTCCGGIVGMGETRRQRAGLLHALTCLPQAPQSVPINQLVPVPGTPLADARPLDPFEFIRTIAVARIVLPDSVVRLSAGRQQMSDEMQAWCFFAGAGSIFVGDRLLTTPNPAEDHDLALLKRLDLHPMDRPPTEGGTLQETTLTRVHS
ncbi:MAG: biotin synthase BioB [Castellaniella sp.]|uniref:biotin synthase BioB n=1 Tax=Castellaniella sp. TaxID=1955812 RepID=UPI001212D01A|nr:biotin synthase BioB [Castellaniella sp.]TAN29820.1 MAG: biotin synthase BioB [Castellaniella sp.]